MNQIEVVAAIFIKNNLVFCAQRANKGPLGLKWEFPGGKIEMNETKEEALIREIREELDTEITVDSFFMTINHAYVSFELTMHTYLCTVTNGELSLHEHINACWLGKEDLKSLDWAEADYPIVEKLIEYL